MTTGQDEAPEGSATSVWRTQRGVALLLVLWTLALLSLIAAAFTATSRTEAQLARNFVDNAQARALAEAGIARAILGLLEPRPEDRWRADNFDYTFPLADGEVAIAIQDEAGKVDLNRAPDALLREMFLAVGIGGRETDGLVRAINGRRPQGETRPAGAQDEITPASGFASVEELLGVPGMTPELYARIAPDLTVYSNRLAINPMTAPPEVLAAAPGISPSVVEAILSVRNGSGNFAALVARLEAMGANRYGPLTTARTFTIRAEARTTAGAVFIREAVVALPRRAAPPFQILAWRRGQP
jgi:general secretion pathway protein K